MNPCLRLKLAGIGCSNWAQERRFWQKTKQSLPIVGMLYRQPVGNWRLQLIRKTPTKTLSWSSQPAFFFFITPSPFLLLHVRVVHSRLLAPIFHFPLISHKCPVWPVFYWDRKFCSFSRLRRAHPVRLSWNTDRVIITDLTTPHFSSLLGRPTCDWAQMSAIPSLALFFVSMLSLCVRIRTRQRSQQWHCHNAFWAFSKLGLAFCAFRCDHMQPCFVFSYVVPTVFFHPMCEYRLGSQVKQ